MKISELPFRGTLIVPENLEEKKTSEIIEAGMIVSFKHPGLQYYSPIEDIIYDKFSKVIEDGHKSMGALKVKIPNCMKLSTLKKGEPVVGKFKKRLVTLPEPMDEYILMITHEMEFLEWLGKDPLSHKSLPMRLFSHKDILRVASHGKGILKSREFGAYIMVSLDRDHSGFKQSLQEYSEMCENLFEGLGISFYKYGRIAAERTLPHKMFDREYFYICPEGDNLYLEGDNIKALSLSMGYRYKPDTNPCTFADEKNKLRKPVVGAYGFGVERLIYAAFDSSRDRQGFDLPEQIRPFNYSILLFDGHGSSIAKADSLYELTQTRGIEGVLFDDRRNTKRMGKVRLSDFLGIPKKIIISKSGIRLQNRDNSLENHYFCGIEDALNYMEKK